MLHLTDKKLREIFDKGIFRGEIKFDEPMSSYTSLRIGGPADILVFPNDVVSLKRVLVAAQAENIRVLVLGSGTNLLFNDHGFRGIIISLRAFKGIEVIKNLKSVAPHLSSREDFKIYTALYVEAGRRLGGLLDFARDRGLSGIEPLAGIPGTLGGAICMNAGSFGMEIKDVLISAAFMKKNSEIVIINKPDLGFSYRSSRIPDNAVILSGNILLKKDSPGAVSKRMKHFLDKKRDSQPLGEPSAGCVFKNPVREGDYAGRLIDEAGCKGMAVGGVQVSTVHANYFINKGNATCREFIELMETVRTKVKETSGIILETEINVIGEEG
jgi:UDP-N-acetylmuramate dehydrogenase